MTVRETELVVMDGAEETLSSISWAAVIAGALAAITTSLILMLIGSGLGLTIVSPWANAGATAGTVAISAVIWLVVVQWLSSATGGYLAGRLRTRWSGVHADEVTFRDTAHGFLAWALATVVVAALLTSAIGSITGTAVQTATTIAGGAAQGAAQGATQMAGGIADPTGYYVDSLFRPSSTGGASASGGAATSAPADQPAAPAPATSAVAATPATGPAASTPAGEDVRGEATRILVLGMTSGTIADADKRYLGELVARKTGLSAADAQKRADDVLAQIEAAKSKAKAAADAARKAGATLAILMALALVVGAFVASVAAVLGGHLRDT